jgi:NAD(P)-dependent dehydrogenase (short-subunit alcohol dehydrogenase family)
LPREVASSVFPCFRGKIIATNRTWEDHWVFAITVRNGKLKNIREYIDTQALARASEMALAPGADPSRPIPHETIRKVNDGGSIIMTGSVASVKGFPGFGVYSASKAVLRSFARTWLNELKGRNIRVDVLSPGRWGW